MPWNQSGVDKELNITLWNLNSVLAYISDRLGRIAFVGSANSTRDKAKINAIVTEVFAMNQDLFQASATSGADEIQKSLRSYVSYWTSNYAEQS